MTAFLKRMDFGIAGDLSRPSQATVESQLFDPKAPFAGYGLAGKVVAGKFAPISDKADVVYGVLVRPFPTQGMGDVADVMRRGYMTVVSNSGVAALGGTVYVRVAKGTASKPIGGFEAAADGENTIVVAGATFMGAADAGGNVEIAFNI